MPFSNQSSAAWRQTMLETESSQNLAERSKASSEHWHVSALQYVVPSPTPQMGKQCCPGSASKPRVCHHLAPICLSPGSRPEAEKLWVSYGSSYGTSPSTIGVCLALIQSGTGNGDLDPASAQCHGPKGQSSPVMAANDLHVSKLSQAQRSREIPPADC